jgi:hypothetical protein
MIDPQELVVVGVHLADSREAAYTAGFFLFWALMTIGCGITWLLASDCRPPPSLLQSDDDRKHRDKSLIGR